MDYAREEVRDLALGYLDEVCENYDVDGIELDFFRHLCYFKSVADGGKSSQQERDQLTQLMQQIRTMTEKHGLKRGRPILISIRVPDSIEYCNEIGFDLKQWMADGLIDILITTGYFRLNPWEYSVKLGRKQGVAVYPCLSDSRVQGESRFRRNSIESLRGRAMNVWTSGAQGLYLFNHFNPRASMWNELGSVQTLRYKKKLYFVTVRDGSPASYLAKGDAHRTVPVLTPANPITLASDKVTELNLRVSDDLAEAKKPGRHCKAQLHLEVPKSVQPSELRVQWNDGVLENGTRTAGTWIDFDLPVSEVRRGNNSVSIQLQRSSVPQTHWDLTYIADKLPGLPWKRDRYGANIIDEIMNGALLLADRGSNAGDYLYYRYPWGADEKSQAVIEVTMKVVSGENFLIFSNGVSGNRLSISTDKVSLFHTKQPSYETNTTEKFHDYRIEMLGDEVKVFVDGQLRIHDPKGIAPRKGYPRNELAFGACNSPERGEGLWKTVRARNANVTIHDAVVRIDYSTEE